MAASVIKLEDVWQALDKCIEGYTRRKTTHSWLITYHNKTVVLPLGHHGGTRQNNKEIESGHVRNLARQFGVIECLQQHLKKIY